MTVNAHSPTKGVWSSSVVQRAAACQVWLVDLGACSHQGDCALAVPISGSIVQRRSARYNKRHLWYQVYTGAEFNSKLQLFSTSLVSNLQMCICTARANKAWACKIPRLIQPCLPSQIIFDIQFSFTTQQQVQTFNVSVVRKRKSQCFNWWHHTWSKQLANKTFQILPKGLNKKTDAVSIIACVCISKLIGTDSYHPYILKIY